MISESFAFPVDPHASTLDNCLKAVRDRADLFVLVVGGRYGTQRSDGKSITNLEYLEAKALGLPIFVFVARPILHTLALWKSNPTADFSATVDTPKLYEFVHQLRNESTRWVHGFDTADDIVATLRAQWALLFTDSLAIRAKIIEQSLSPALKQVAPKVLAIVLEKPLLWEFRLFSEALKSELDELALLRNDFRYQLAIGPIERVMDPSALIDLIGRRISELRKVSDSLSQLLNVAAPEAIGPQGVAGNPDLIVYVARRMAGFVKQAIEWSISLKSVDANDEFEPVIDSLSKFSIELVEKVSSFPDLIDQEITKAETALAKKEKYTMELRLKLEAPGAGEDFRKEMERLKQKYGI